MGQPGFFDLEERHRKLTDSGDPLVRLGQVVPWELWRPLLERVHEKERKSNAGRPAWDLVLIWKILVLQALYNLSDDQMEYQIRDRLSFMRFVGLGLEDRIPDAKTIWLYRERLQELGLMQELFARFDGYLREHGYAAKKGQIIDAAIVPVPIQRNDKDENAAVRAGTTPEDWQAQPAKLRQKDRQARWAMKNGRAFFGYKNHLNVDVKHKLIRGYRVTDAATHDGEPFNALLDADNRHGVWADKNYRSQERTLELRRRGLPDRMHWIGHKHRALTPYQERLNRARSRIRARVEHVFGYQQNSMGGKLLRTIGLARAQVKIGLRNLGYNVARFTYLETRGRPARA